MGPVAHTIQAAAGAAILYPAIGYKAFIFGFATVAIDLDHFIEYYLDTGRLDVRGMFEYNDKLWMNIDKYLGLNVFHTIECYLLLFIGSFFVHDLVWVAAGFIYHHILDELYLIAAGWPFIRAFSVTEYFIRKKSNKYRTSVYQLPPDDACR